ncbi:hypothetical protein [Thiococcus pfennigii]|uniref:hypothetical protein n=1 Tax=Thiococcus pfennigii TaxID=1057 RepID=UPI0019064718|nr:hypothetical protein [Thiococcus pfennigii]
MNAKRLLTLYDRIADAPNAIPRLRRFVLNLAVRGKPVAQDPADEPASELLKRIAAEKARLVKAGEIRKPKAVPPLVHADLPFTLPHGWAWTQIAELGVISPRNEAPDDLEASCIPMSMIAAEYAWRTNTNRVRGDKSRRATPTLRTAMWGLSRLRLASRTANRRYSET